MNFNLPKIYPITDESLSGLSHSEQVRYLAAGGARVIQIREKTAVARVFFESALSVLTLADKLNIRIIINDRVDLALAVGAYGVHLGQNDMPPRAARKILGKKAVIGLSTHTVEQALAALHQPIDYIAVGPIFPTRTKQNPDAVLGLNGLRMVRKAVGTFPLVAIGGINQTNVASIFEAGADSAAVIGAILSDGSNITERMKQMTNLDQTC